MTNLLWVVRYLSAFLCLASLLALYLNLFGDFVKSYKPLLVNIAVVSALTWVSVWIRVVMFFYTKDDQIVKDMASRGVEDSKRGHIR